MGQLLDNIGLWVEYYWGQISDWLLHATTPGHKFALAIVVVLLFVAVMSLLLWLVDRPKRSRSWLVAIAFAGPALLAVTFGLVYPAIRTAQASVHDRSGKTFIGLDNYATVLTNPEFQLVLRNTVVWVFLVPILSTLIGLVYAVLVDRTKFERFAKTLVFLPMAISMVGASIIWKFVYEYRSTGSEQVGLLNQVLKSLGLETQQFIINAPLNTLFLIVVMVWIQAGFAMTILSASIKAIPEEIIEAARLDGLHGFGMFRHITVPSIRPALVVVLTTIAMGTLKVFDIVRTMAAGGSYQTSVVANEYYTQTFKFNEKGIGATLAVVLFILVVPLIVYNVRQMRKVEEIR